MKKYDFIELPIIVFNGKEQEITNKQPDECELIEVVRKVKAAHIESYEEAIPKSDFREDNKIWTEVFMVSGNSFIVNLPLPKFEDILETHFISL